MNDVVFLFDVDDTLLDNDGINADLDAHIERVFGADGRKLYREIYERVRDEVHYADYLGAIQRFRVQCGDEVRAQDLGAWLLEYPFAERLYPHALDAIAHVAQFGPAVVLSDGDAVLQPRKISASGIADAVDGNVLVYVHKETMLDDVERRFPARHYVIVEDKLRVLDALKQHWRERLTTVFVRQGHYAHDPELIAKYPPAQITLDRIDDLCGCGRENFLRQAAKQELFDTDQRG
ncbi:MAG TPA: haloacid dehalogenase-like hydrolase [Rhodanobacteraceae bacterium]|nr:haloacid dehalogenase-like hydrolase [Rhodanobacteraceae bacterium]